MAYIKYIPKDLIGNRDSMSDTLEGPLKSRPEGPSESSPEGPPEDSWKRYLKGTSEA